ncbi:MAG TPA: hypothetical protein VGQ83_27275 [Polyangia bacterium]|jgi:hypothetical protein
MRETRAIRPVAACAVALLLALAAGCDDKTDPYPPVQCSDNGGRPASVGGEWVLEGEGVREACGDPDLNAKFRLGPTHFRVREVDPNPPRWQEDAGIPQADAGRDGGAPADGPPADGGAPADGPAADGGASGDGPSADGAADAPAADAQEDAQTDAPVYEPATLGLEGPIEGFTLEGTIHGYCATFRTTEQLAEGGTITYSFTGNYSGGLRGLKGSFSGTGPGGCVARGKFTVEVQ